MARDALIERLLYREALNYGSGDRSHTVCCDASHKCPAYDIEPGDSTEYSEVEEYDADFGDVDGSLVKHLGSVKVLPLLANPTQFSTLGHLLFVYYTFRAHLGT